MTTWNLSDDEVLLSLLSDVIDEVDPVPEAAVQVAKAAAGLDSLDAELAALVADSLLDEGSPMVRRDLNAERLVTFVSSRFSLDIELPPDAGTLYGALSPPESQASLESQQSPETESMEMEVEIEVETLGSTSRTRTDGLGRFHVEVGRGPCRLRVVRDDGAVVTPWITR